MNTDYSHIVFILDRSGSMASQAGDAIGGFNAFIESQKKLPGKATLSLILFDNRYEEPYSFTPIDMVPELTNKTFVPRGGTALLDAVGRAINETGAHLAAMSENERPGRVLVAVLTDGEENESREFSPQRIKDMIEHQQAKYAWQITFLSSDIRASEQALSYGFTTGNTRSSTNFKAAMDGYVISAGLSRSVPHEAYVANVVCAFDMAAIDDVLAGSVDGPIVNADDSGVNSTDEKPTTTP